MTVISVNNLCKSFKIKTKEPGFKGSIKSIISPRYKEIEAVRDVSFNVEKGEILAFIGPNGAGKSTTIKMLTGILYPTEGNMKILGLDPSTERKKLSYKIGTVFGQKSQLWFHLPPIDSFNLLGKIYDMEEVSLKKRINFLKEIFEIEELMDIPVRKLSLGQRIRCEIAASLIHNPEIIFLDEPTIGLDVIVKQNIRDLILRINREEKRTIFLTSHDAGDIEQLCKRAIVINHGQLVLDESIKNLKYNYLNKKIIEVKFKEEVHIDKNKFKVLKSNGYGVKIEIDTLKENIEEVLTEIIKYGSILDINILEPPMEEIISHIYSESKVGDCSE
ncbi:ABC transporter family protein [Clostridium argentinense CDC 2741]|uniref:ABC transporter family protein n=1 Tax=Clostridium argentinense CDC 2741 TaxID=1418104 RepID=A0A0C1QVN0_9CLOT|nr:ATP-binding cassette domain-containing protein [Clostridium argentinense]ARC83806.1 ABC transporter [Clostridium argentinense]KIE45022.1 ABC transporter family protein [Clostridium argentinense CDC 2741]NFF39714.1 ATP-binding cassette domain-containing protein [Clostridium argentinense]NFP49714.1 ATP-binding cassette domain-containing protein [Clostridium argentinense]NFP72115.1 ATP-binding cassette domain-containing protein [Clostridium argentinense]